MHGISSNGNGAVVECRRAFPFAGELKKRELEFVA